MTHTSKFDDNKLSWSASGVERYHKGKLLELYLSGNNQIQLCGLAGKTWRGRLKKRDVTKPSVFALIYKNTNEVKQ